MSEYIYGGVVIEHGAANGETRLERREEIVRCRDCKRWSCGACMDVDDDGDVLEGSEPLFAVSADEEVCDEFEEASWEEKAMRRSNRMKRNWWM